MKFYIIKCNDGKYRIGFDSYLDQTIISMLAETYYMGIPPNCGPPINNVFDTLQQAKDTVKELIEAGLT